MVWYAYAGGSEAPKRNGVGQIMLDVGDVCTGVGDSDFGFTQLLYNKDGGDGDVSCGLKGL